MSDKTDQELENEAAAIMLAGFRDENAEPLSKALIAQIERADITRGGAICSLLVAALGVLGDELETKGFDPIERAVILAHAAQVLVGVAIFEVDRHDQSSKTPPAGN